MCHIIFWLRVGLKKTSMWFSMQQQCQCSGLDAAGRFFGRLLGVRRFGGSRGDAERVGASLTWEDLQCCEGALQLLSCWGHYRFWLGKWAWILVLVCFRIRLHFLHQIVFVKFFSHVAGSLLDLHFLCSSCTWLVTTCHNTPNTWKSKKSQTNSILARLIEIGPVTNPRGVDSCEGALVEVFLRL